MRMGTKKRPAARTTAPIASLLIALTVARSIDAPLPCLTVSITTRKRPPCDTLRAAEPGFCRLWGILAQKGAGMERRPPRLALPNGTGIIVDRGDRHATTENADPGICRRVHCHADLPSGAVVRVQPYRGHPARPPRVAGRPHSSVRDPLGAVQGVLGRSVGPRADAGPRPFERHKLLGSVLEALGRSEQTPQGGPVPLGHVHAGVLYQ